MVRTINNRILVFSFTRSVQQISGVEGSGTAVTKLGIGSLMQAGILAGLLQKCISFPLDLVTVRVALGINTSILGGKAYNVSLQIEGRYR